jgi:pimeloyl-ACP methyl ester carboxylesterase
VIRPEPRCEPPPGLPPRRTVTIPGIGQTPIRIQLWPGRVPVLLLHGWGITSDFNFCHLLTPAAARYGVVAMDLRGHGRGLPVPADQRFTISQCADDVISILGAIDVPEVVACGYSLGGLVALELAYRYPDRVAALLLQATAGTFDSSADRVLQTLLRALRPLASRSHGIGKSAPLHYFRRFRARNQLTADWWPWLQGELRLCDPLVLVDAFLDEYVFDFLPITPALADVPTAVVVTARDRSVPPTNQRLMARRLQAKVIELDAEHHVFLTDPIAYVETTLRAVDAITDDRMSR